MKHKLLLLIFLLSKCIVFAQETNNSLESYHGIGYQKGSKEYWSINIQKINNNEYNVVYPSIPCRAKWSLVKQDKGSFLYKESLTSGFQNCIDNGYISIIDDESSTKRFYYYLNLTDEAPYAYGFLKLGK